MIGIPEFKIANCFVAKLVNIPDIHCVSRLAFDDFNSHGCSPRLIQRFLNLIFLAILMASSTCYASEPYLDDNRVAYISSVLQAFSKTQLQDIVNTHKYISVVDNNNCRSSLSDLRVQCLLSFANKNCKETRSAKLKDNCELYSDIIIVNKLSEKAFIDRTERYRILKNAGYDHRTAIANRLQQKYARIVTQFSLTEAANCDNEDFTCLAKGLDQFCLDYTNSQSLSWQYCTSAMLWFIGTSKKH